MTTGRKAMVQAIRCMGALLFTFLLGGCGAGDYLTPQQLPYAKLAIPYTATNLGRGTTLEVLNIARDPAYQFAPDEVEQALLTQSDTVIAYSGRSADGLKSWLNLIAFDEFRMTARRKYFFCIDERATVAPTEQGQLLFPPRKGIIFESQFVIDPEVLTTPYATPEAQQIAIVRWLAMRFDQDMTALLGNPQAPARGSQSIAQSGMMVRQTFTGLLVELDASPGLAARLATPEGVPFPHPSLNEGRIRLLTQNGIGQATIRVNFPLPAAGQ